MKKAVLLLIALSSISRTYAQVDGQDAKLLAANVLFGGITTGLGAVIHKGKQERLVPTFFKGFGYGCLGGGLLYTGKKMSNLIYQDKLVAGGWGSKLVHNAGASIMENASLHRPAFSHYNLYVGFFRLEFDWQESLNVMPKVMPLTLAATAYSLHTYSGSIDWSKTLSLGSPYINTSRKKNFDGITIKSIATIYEDASFSTGHYHAVMAHENGHVLQGQEYYVINTYFNKTSDNLQSRYEWWGALRKYIYLDISAYDPFYLLVYNYSITQAGCYWKNPYEFEAERMSINRHMDMSDYCK